MSGYKYTTRPTDAFLVLLNWHWVAASLSFHIQTRPDAMKLECEQFFNGIIAALRYSVSESVCARAPSNRCRKAMHGGVRFTVHHLQLYTVRVWETQSTWLDRADCVPGKKSNFASKKKSNVFLGFRVTFNSIHTISPCVSLYYFEDALAYEPIDLLCSFLFILCLIFVECVFCTLIAIKWSKRP